MKRDLVGVGGEWEGSGECERRVGESGGGRETGSVMEEGKQINNWYQC